jgi:cytidine deaminase
MVDPESPPPGPPSTAGVSLFYSSISSFILSSSKVLFFSLQEDYTLWMASLWMLWNKQQLLNTAPSLNGPSQSSWSLYIDFLTLGSILVLKKAKDYRLRGNEVDATNILPTTSTDKTETKRNKTPTDVAALQQLRGLLTIAATAKPGEGISQHSRPQSPPLLPFLPTDSLTNQSKQQPHQEQRFLELLVHNVSHTDLVLSLDAPPPLSSTTLSQEECSYCLCRPRFSAFDGYSRRIVDFISMEYGARDKSSHAASDEPFIPADKLIRFPRYERSDDNTKNYQINPEPSKALDKIPVGFVLTSNGRLSNDSGAPLLNVSSSEMNDLRIRGRDAPRVLAVTSSIEEQRSLRINAVFFPLLASLIPLWQTKMKEKYTFLQTPTSLQAQQEQHTNIKQVLILVSGVATPRNWTHSADGNSTYQCARMMKLFLQTIYPRLVVVHIHSGPDRDILRYDENILFVQQELLPCIQGYRDAHAKGLPYPDEIGLVPTGRIDDSEKDQPFSTDWRKSFSVTLSFADGSPARNHAIQAALRTYRPTYFHFWQLKTFWHDSKIVDSDVEVHSFEEMETLPPIETTQLAVDKPQVLKVVEEMKRFRDDMIQILKEDDKSNDIRRFWLRKTQKPVLAVLAVKELSGSIKLYRGTNMEVSMPTGSLCAERNVIGSALADNPGLKRQDLMLIAVLAVPVPKSTSSGGRIVANASFVRPHSSNSLGSIQQMDENSSHSGKPPLIPSRKSSIGEEEDWIFQDSSAAAMNKSPALNPIPSATLHVPPDLSQAGDHSPSASSTPIRRISLYKSQQQTRAHKRTVLVHHSDTDINPLRPCGACNEWLKKIAESNPYFTIVTFTDSACNGIYCTPCEE